MNDSPDIIQNSAKQQQWFNWCDQQLDPMFATNSTKTQAMIQPTAPMTHLPVWCYHAACHPRPGWPVCVPPSVPSWCCSAVYPRSAWGLAGLLIGPHEDSGWAPGQYNMQALKTGEKTMQLSWLEMHFWTFWTKTGQNSCSIHNTPIGSAFDFFHNSIMVHPPSA